MSIFINLAHMGRRMVRSVLLSLVSLLIGCTLLGGAACGGGVTPNPPPRFPTPTPSPSVVPTETSVPLTPSPTFTWSLEIAYYVKIRYIKYDGDMPFSEADEYVSIRNEGSEPINLEGWVLKNITEGNATFTFPFFILDPDSTCRVYTDQFHEDWGGLRFKSKVPIWNNSYPDVAALYDSRGNLISERSYVP